MSKITFLELARKIISEEKRPLTPEEIWEIAKLKGYDRDMASQGKTPWRSIGAQIYVNMKEDTEFIKIGSRPKKFFLSSFSDETDKLENIDKQPIRFKSRDYKYSEKELHPFLAYIAFSYLKAYTKTIEHVKSKKNQYGEWMHPDMVGIYFPFKEDEWLPEVIEFSSVTGNLRLRFFSFEIKKELNFSNLRESFFQAVSNSSWANEGYLVTSEILNDDDFYDEVKRLSISFGIGILKINIDDPDDFEIISPSKYKEELDWETINKLADMNPDFKELLKRIKIDVASKEIRKEKYDKILGKDELLTLIKKP